VTQWTERGILYVATGELYIELAVRSAESVKKHCGDIRIHLFTDRDTAEFAVFDSTTIIQNPHRRSRLDCFSQTPFQRTLYLDAETCICTDIREIYDVLDRFDIAMAHAHLRNRKAMKEHWRIPIPDAFPQFNSGVILYNKSAPVLDLLNKWKEAYFTAGFRKDQTTLRELLYLSNIRIAVLPPEYNIRFRKYLRVWNKYEAVPKVLHLEKYKYDVDRKINRGLRHTIRRLRRRLVEFIKMFI